MSANKKLKAAREAKQRKRFKERKLAAWARAVPKLRGPMPFAAILLLLFCLSVPALASDEPQGPKVTGHCCQICASNCQCDPYTCPCPKVVTFPDGRQQLYFPRPVLVDKREGLWPAQGPFLWAGVAARWLAGADRRFVEVR